MAHETVAFTGIVGEVVQFEQPDGRVFEQYRRAPGVRLIIVSPDSKVLMTREHRTETGGVDLRLPGGKVRDTIEEWRGLLASGQVIMEAIIETGVKEGLEETGRELWDLEYITKANAGSTVEWDLHYLLARHSRKHADGQQLEHGEQIECVEMTFDEIREAIAAGQMQEWRSVGVLLGLVFPALEAAGS